MGWMQRQVRRFVKRAAKYAGIPLRDPALVAMLGNQPASSGVDVDQDTALNYSALWAAVNVIASNVAALPAIPYEIRKDGHYEAVNTPAHRFLLTAPNDEMTPYTFTETVQAHAMTWGNGYAELERDDPREPAYGANVLLPNQVSPSRDEDTGEIYYQFTAIYSGEEDRRIPWWKVLHIPGLGFDGLRGYDVIDRARESLGLGMAAEKFGGAFFGRGCTLGGILEAPEELEMTEKAKKNLRESFELLHRGPDNSHRVAILEQGIKYQSLGVPPETAQFLETRKFQTIEIARWFNIPPHLLRDLDHATFSNIEQQGIEFFAITLRPWLLRWQQEYRRKLFGLPDQTRFFVCHDPHNLQMMDANSRFDVYAKGRNMGVYTLNNILKKEGMNPLPSEIGDTRLAPSTMKVLGARGEPINPDDVKKALDLLSALSPIFPDDAKKLLLAMVPGIAGDALDALVRRLPDYKPTKDTPDATADD